MIWALGSVTEAHAPIRTLQEVRDDLRARLRNLMPSEQCEAILQRIAAIDELIAARKQKAEQVTA